MLLFITFYPNASCGSFFTFLPGMRTSRAFFSYIIWSSISGVWVLSVFSILIGLINLLLWSSLIYLILVIIMVRVIVSCSSVSKPEIYFLSWSLVLPLTLSLILFFSSNCLLSLLTFPDVCLLFLCFLPQYFHFFPPTYFGFHLLFFLDS